ncbi:MAG: hypothetical protein ACTSUN_06320 [Promethearchaeota archaeon]
MKAIKLDENIYWVSANIHLEDLFEVIWPIPNGVALNSYVVKGEKIALIELVSEWGDAAQTLIRRLRFINLKLLDTDYLILNHLGPDYAGFINVLKSINPDIETIATEKGIALVDALYGIKENLRAVKTEDTLDLGNGFVFKFVEIPNVHWLETIVTHKMKSKILFSSDAFGSFGVQEAFFDVLY